jgi:DNA-binding winged helix-turn-helix (wHTH) protein
VQLDADAHEVTISGREVKLSAKPFAILAALMREPSKMVSRRELVNLVWGPEFAVGGHALDVHIHALRQQLARAQDHRCRLMTIKGVGFKLKPLSAATPVLRTGADDAMLPPAVEGDALLNSTAGRLKGVCAPFTESSLSFAQNRRKPSMRRRGRPVQKAVLRSSRHAAALAG